MGISRGVYAFVAMVCLGVPLLVEWYSTPAPQVRRFHVKAFRYGTQPSVLRANRGDELRLTFETLDTGHSFFLQDYGIDAKITPSREDVEVFNPFRPFVPSYFTEELRFTAGLPGVLGHLACISRFRCHVYCGPMHGFEQGDLVVRPNWLYAGAMGMLLLVVVTGVLRARFARPECVGGGSGLVDLNPPGSAVNWVLRRRWLQFLCTLVPLAGLVLVVLAGVLGTKVAARNVATMLTWVVWMGGLTLGVSLVSTRLWCLFCPLPVLGEYVQRLGTFQVRAARGGSGAGNWYFSLGLRWPKALRGPWLRLIVLLLLGTFSGSLAGRPQWTGLAVLGMTVLALALSVGFEGRVFCRYVCPVAAFVGTYAPLGRLQVRARDRAVCRTCKDKPCLRGNAAGWGCPYGLAVPGIDRDEDCGFCTECFKSCPNDNVQLGWRTGAMATRLRSYGDAWQVLVLFGLALAYSLTVHSPWPVMRDPLNVLDKGSWLQSLVYMGVLWAMLLGAVPGLFFWAAGLGRELAGKTPGLSEGALFKRTVPALIPLGLGLWAAFFTATVLPNMTFVLQAFSDPFGWGWNLLGMAGTPWIQVLPWAIPWLQAAQILAGLAVSLQCGYRCWYAVYGAPDAALWGFVPMAGLMVLAAGMMLCYVTNF